MNDMTINLALDQRFLERIQALAKEKGRTAEEEAVFLLEKGAALSEEEIVLLKEK